MRSVALAASLVAVLGLGMLAGCAAPPAPVAHTGRIDGAVVDGLLNPYGNLTVRLLELDRRDVTSGLGGFTFRGLPPGTYTLVAETPGAQADVEFVEVSGDRIARVILQLERDEMPRPFATIQKNIGHADLALPGSECWGCRWSADMPDRPHQVVARAVWDSTALGEDSLRMVLLDGKGNLVAEATGTSPLELHVRDADVPRTDRLQLTFTFPEGFHPRPFEMESFIDLYYAPDTA